MIITVAADFPSANELATDKMSVATIRKCQNHKNKGEKP